MRRFLFATPRCVLVTVLIAALPARALFGQIGVSFTPSGGSWQSGTQVGVTIKFCANPEQYYLSHWITFNGQDVTGQFTSAGGYDASCVFQQYWSGTVTLATGTNTLSAGFTAYYFDGADVYWETPYSNSAYYTGNAPIVDYPALEDYGRCAMSCFAATYAQSTVPYYSLDTPRNVTLVYNGDRVDPKPFVHADVTVSGTLPNFMQLRARRVGGADITFLNGETTIIFSPPTTTGTWRLGGQFSAAANGMGATGAYLVEIIVGQMFGSTLQETVVATRRVIVVNENDSPIARGWTLAGIQRLYPISGGGALVTDGSGSATYFGWDGSQFIAPPGDFSRLTSSGGTYTRGYPDSTKVTFNSSGLMTAVTDRFNNQTWFSYTGSNLTTIGDPNGTTQTLAYGSYGLSSVAALGRSTTFAVPSNRTLTAITDPDNVSTNFLYDGSLRLYTVTDRRGTQVAELAYHSYSGKLSSVTGPTIPIYPSGSTRPVETLSAWQHVGVPYHPTGFVWAALARSDTVRGAATDPGEHTIRFTVNSFGQPLVSSSPLGDTVMVSYNANGQATQVSERLGVTTSLVYDASGFLTSRTVGGTSTNFRNGGWDQPDSTWGQGTAVRFFLNPGNGRVDSVRVGGKPAQAPPDQTITRFTYDSRGRVLAARDNLGHLLSQSWYASALGNHSKDSLPSSTIVTYTHDSYGRTSTTAATGQPTRSVTYDVVNRTTHAYDGVNANATRFFFNGAGLDSVTDARGQVYRFGTNGLGWTTVRRDPVGDTETFDYDAEGLVRRVINRRNQAITMTYDSLHRPTWRGGTGVVDVSLSYSGDGRVVSEWNAYASNSTYLDALRRLPDSVRTVLYAPGGGSSQTYVQHYRHGAQGWLDSTWVTGGVYTQVRRYAWRPNVGVLDSMRFWGAWTRFGYDADLTPRVVRFFSINDSISGPVLEGHGAMGVNTPGLWENYGYDAQGRLTRAQWGGYNGPRREYSYNGLGQLAQTTFHGPVTGCNFNWQTGYSCSGGGVDSTHTVTYETGGNVGNRIDHGGTYTLGNHISTFDGCSYTPPDADGNITSRSNCGAQSATFTWTGDGQLTSYTVGSSTIGMAYDPAGRLVRRDVNGVAQSYFLWDGDGLVAELNSSGTSIVAEYSYYPGGLDNLHAFAYGGAIHYAKRDALGNVRVLTDGNGTVTRSYVYDEWGQRISTSDGPFNQQDRVRWKGALWMGPELDLYYMRSRWYEPRSGRFLSEDPAGLQGGINQYAFAASDPINGRDPTGLSPCLEGEDGHEDPYVGEGIGVTWHDCRRPPRRTVAWGPQSGQALPVCVPDHGGYSTGMWVAFGSFNCFGGALAYVPPPPSQPARACSSGRPMVDPLDVMLPVSRRGAYKATSPHRTRGTRPHIGVDHAAADGTLTYARLSGTVVVDSGGDAGLHVDILSDNGVYRSRSLHLSRALVRTGQRVSERQPIGYTGRSGPPDLRAHLHVDLFNLQVGGFVNPYAGCGQR